MKHSMFFFSPENTKNALQDLSARRACTLGLKKKGPPRFPAPPSPSFALGVWFPGITRGSMQRESPAMHSSWLHSRVQLRGSMKRPGMREDHSG